MGEVSAVCSERTEVGAAANAEVEDAGEDRHRDGGRCRRNEPQDLRLEHEVVDGRRRPRHDAEEQHGRERERRRLPEEERPAHDDEHPAQQRKAMPSVGTREDEAREETADTEQHKCKCDRLRRECSDAVQERLDVAVYGKICRCEQRRHHVDARDLPPTDERRQIVKGKCPLGRTLRQEKGEIDERDCSDRRQQQEGHAPARRKSDDTPERQTEDHRDGAARHDHAERHGLMDVRHEAYGKRRRNRPENRVRTRDDDACPEQHGVARRESGGELSCGKEPHHQQHEPLQLHTAGEQHEGQRQQRDHPRIESDHPTRLRRRHGK